ncbi:MAG TPA: DinB family protein [Candidatus Lustribacter sp.]|nr:DinB family protein [Candidatus Lustribacter sp.]
MTNTTSTTGTPRAGEQSDLLETLATHRHFLRFTVRDLSDEQALQRTTASALTLSALIKHVADTEEGWVDFIIGGPSAMGGAESWNDGDPDHSGGDGDGDGWPEGEDPRFVIEPGTTLAGLLERYADVARRTDELVATVDLDASHPLPEAPWFEPGARWSARRVLLHIIAETAQHAGHADIIRESLDGAKSMG